MVQTRELIDKYCETFEKEILNLFDRAYRKGDPKMMHVWEHAPPPPFYTHYPLFSVALCPDPSGFQRRGILRAGICEST